MTVLSFVFVLGVLVFVHELGHFLIARWLGVRVLTFAIGFGPKILKIRRGEIDYAIGIIPLGGYVKMAGENPDDPHSGAPDEFMARPKWDRFRILIMGPVMNIVLAVALMTIVFTRGATVPAFQDDPVVVGAVTAGAPAEKAGIRPGDRITKVGNQDVPTWERFYLEIGGRARRETPLTVVRDGRVVVIRMTPAPQTRMEVGDIGILPDVHPHIRTVTAGSPAAAAGIKPGDMITALDGETMVFSDQLSTAIRKHPGQPVTLSVIRDGQPLVIVVTPRRQGDVGLIGVQIENELQTIQPGPIGAFKLSLARNVEFAGLIVRTLGGLFTRETSPSQLMGPVAIAQLSGDYAAAGWMALFTFMASLSLNLGLLNLLPIPVLDGGHLFIMVIEGLVRRDFSLKVKERLMTAGFVLLMGLMVTVIFNDLSRLSLFDRFFPRAR
jgi:regulator of sigma E protease